MRRHSPSLHARGQHMQHCRGWGHAAAGARSACSDCPTYSAPVSLLLRPGRYSSSLTVTLAAASLRLRLQARVSVVHMSSDTAGWQAAGRGGRSVRGSAQHSIQLRMCLGEWLLP